MQIHDRPYELSALRGLRLQNSIGRSADGSLPVLLRSTAPERCGTLWMKLRVLSPPQQHGMLEVATVYRYGDEAWPQRAHIM